MGRIFLISFLFLSLLSCRTTKENLTEKTQKYFGSQEIAINTVDTIHISGTLEFVSNNQLVIILAGSGPTDRNCNSDLGMKSDAFAMLAHELSEAGISSFRYDKRGIGESTKVSNDLAKFSDRVIDVSAIVDHFSLDFKEVILLGHSEGALIGAITSAKKASVRRFVSVAGMSISMDKMLLEQYAQYPRILPEVERHIEEIKRGDTLSEVHMVLQLLFRPDIVPVLRAAFQWDPQKEISKVKKPTLVISGSCDVQVPVHHSKSLHESCDDSELKIIDGMGHVLKQLDSDCSNKMSAYTDPSLVINPQFVSEILKFLNNK